MKSLYKIDDHTYECNNILPKNGDWFVGIIDNGSEGSPHYHVAKMINVKEDKYDDGCYAAIDKDGTEFTCGYHGYENTIIRTSNPLIDLK